MNIIDSKANDKLKSITGIDNCKKRFFGDKKILTFPCIVKIGDFCQNIFGLNI